MDPSTTLREVWDTTRLRLLVEIERRGSVSAAARAIGIGQPTASQHVRLLETAAGRRLVERDGRGSRLTEAGRVLAARAGDALSALETAEEELRALFGAAGVTPDRDVITYCNAGVSASVGLFALHLAGHTNATNYAGSWYDWERDPTSPIETG